MGNFFFYACSTDQTSANFLSTQGSHASIIPYPALRLNHTQKQTSRQLYYKRFLSSFITASAPKAGKPRETFPSLDALVSKTARIEDSCRSDVMHEWSAGFQQWSTHIPADNLVWCFSRNPAWDPRFSLATLRMANPLLLRFLAVVCLTVQKEVMPHVGIDEEMAWNVQMFLNCLQFRLHPID